MESVAKEMERRGLDLPLLIGGATTSRQHTAVRIAPEYGQPVVHVIDASRVVGVVSDLLDPERRSKLDHVNREDQERLRLLHAEREAQPLLPHRIATERRTPIVWRREDLPEPAFTGARVIEPDLAELRPYIDWTFFFTAWELKGRYPQILDHPRHGEAARELFEAANELLDTIVTDGSLSARGVYGFWPASAEGDDILLADEHRFPMLRQQADHGDDRPSRSLADYIAPADTGLADHIGAFAVTAGIGADELAGRFEADHDDYNAIMVKALADRLAEAFAEWLHQRGPARVVRVGAGDDGRRPARRTLPRDPAGVRLPGLSRPHSEGDAVRAAGRPERRHRPHRALRDDPRGERFGLVLRAPGGSVLQRRAAGSSDQVEDYAARCGMNRREAETWLRPNLAYEPDLIVRASGGSAGRGCYRGRSPMGTFWHSFADMAAVESGGELVIDAGRGRARLGRAGTALPRCDRGPLVLQRRLRPRGDRRGGRIVRCCASRRTRPSATSRTAPRSSSPNASASSRRSRTRRSS